MKKINEAVNFHPLISAQETKQTNKKLSFLIRISSVNVTKRNPFGKLQLLWSESNQTNKQKANKQSDLLTWTISCGKRKEKGGKKKKY